MHQVASAQDAPSSFLLEKIAHLEGELFEKELKLSSVMKKMDRLLLAGSLKNSDDKPSIMPIMDETTSDNMGRIVQTEPAAPCDEKASETIEKQQIQLSILEAEIDTLKSSIASRDMELQTLTMDLIALKEEHEECKNKVT